MEKKVRNFSRRLVACLLCMALIVTYAIPVSVFAESDSNHVSVVKDGKNGAEVKYDKDGNVTTGDNWVISTMKKVDPVVNGEEGEMDVTLRLKTKKGVKVTQEAADAATVLVIDASGSMDYKLGNTTRLAAAKAEANEFLANYVKDAGNAHRYVAIVEFGTNANTALHWVDANAGNNTVSEAVTNAVNSIHTGFEYTGMVSRSFVEWDGPFQGYSCTYEGCNKHFDLPWIAGIFIDHSHKVEAQVTDRGGTNMEGGLVLARNLLSTGLAEGGKIAGTDMTSMVLLSDGLPTTTVYSDDINDTKEIQYLGYAGSDGGSDTDKEDYDNIPGIVSQIKGINNSKCYGIAYSTNEKLDDKTIDKWFAENAKMTGAYKASDAKALEDAFKAIVKEVKTDTVTTGMEVTSNLPDESKLFVTFASDASGNMVVSKVDGTFTAAGANYTWKPANGTTDANNITTYELKYRIKLDSTQKDFDETKEYSTGTAKVSYTHGDSPAHDVTFNDVKVKGVIPTWNYTIKMYELSRESLDQSDEVRFGTATLVKEYPGSQKANTDLTGLFAYAKAMFEHNKPEYKNNFDVKSIEQSYTLDTNNKVLKVYYAPVQATVDIDYVYDTKVVNRDGTDGSTYGEKVTDSAMAWVGDSYELAQTAIDSNDMHRNIKHSYVANDSNIKVNTVARTGNKVTVKYTADVDYRINANVTVVSQFKEWNYELVNGRYVEKSSDDATVVASKTTSQAIEGLKDHETYTFAPEAYEGYTLESYVGTNTVTMADGKLSMPLTSKDGKDVSHVITLTYKKNNVTDNRGPAREIKVTREYTLNNVSYVEGQKTTATTTNAAVEKFTYYDDETFAGISDTKLAEYKAYKMNEKDNNEAYTFSESDAAAGKCASFTVDGNKEITLHFEKTVYPAKDTVSVIRIYHDPIQKTGDDDKTYIDDDERRWEYSDPEESDEMYIGEYFTADSSKCKDGYTFNQTESDSLTAVVGTDKVINLHYYPVAKDERTKGHIIVTYTYITKAMKVNEKGYSEEVEIKDIITLDQAEGFVGDEKLTVTDITSPEDADVPNNAAYDKYLDNKAYTHISGTTGDVTYTTKDQQINLVYERNADAREEASLSVIYKYINHVRAIVNGVAEWVEPEDKQYEEKNINLNIRAFGASGNWSTESVALNNAQLYVGEKYQLDLTGANIHTEDGVDVEYTALTGNPEKEVTLTSNTAVTFGFEKYGQKFPEQPVTVVNVYHVTQQNANGTDTILEPRTVKSAPVTKEVGETFKATPSLEGNKYDKIEVTVAKAPVVTPVEGEITRGPVAAEVAAYDEGTVKIGDDYSVEFAVENVPTVVTYNYYRTTGSYHPVEITINYKYQTTDYDPATGIRNVVKTVETPSGAAIQDTVKSYEGLSLSYDTFKNYGENDGFKFVGNEADLKIEALENHNYTIDLLFNKDIDTRNFDTEVKVVHRYYMHDTSELVEDETEGVGTLISGGAITRTYSKALDGEKTPVWEGHAFRVGEGEGFDAQVEKIFDGKEFRLASVQDVYGLEKIDADSEKNVIYIDYVYDYNASENVDVNVTYIYTATDTRTNTSKVEEETITVHSGNEGGIWNFSDHLFTAKDRSKENYVRVTPDEKMTITFHTGENVMIVNYEYNYRSKKPGTGGRTDDNPPANGGGDNTIPDDDVPLSDLPDDQVPLSDLPGGTEEEEMIPDEEVPLADLPITGGMGVGLFILAGGAIAAAGFGLRKREEEN